MKTRLFALLVAMLMLVSVLALASCDIMSIFGGSEEVNCDNGHTDADGDELCDNCGAAVPKQPDSEDTEFPDREPIFTISFNYHGIIFEDKKKEDGGIHRDDNNRPVRVGAEGDVEICVIEVLQNQAPTKEQLDEIETITYGGITVLGWYDSPEYENEVNFKEVLTADKKVYAKLRIDEPDKKGNEYCGDKAYWEVTRENVLKITGEGAMYDFAYPELAPWYFEDDGVTVRKIAGIKVGNKITHLGAYSFYGNGIAKASEIDIGDAVTSIGDFAFAYSTLLKDVPLTETIEVIGRSAFEGCKSLSSITIPDSVVEIKGYAFARCTAFTYLILGKGVQRIDEYAFNQQPVVKENDPLADRAPDKIHEYIYYRGTQEQFEQITIQLGNFKFLSYGAWIYYLADSYEEDVTGKAGPYWIYNEDGYPVYLSYTIRYMASGNTFPILTDYILIGEDGKTGYYSQDNIDKMNGITYRGYKFASWGNETYIKADNPTPIREHLNFTGKRGDIIGDNATYSYDSATRTLTIKGSGATWDFEGAGDATFFNNNILVVKFEEGITYLGSNLLGGIYSLITVEIPETVTEVHPKLFSGCTNLAAVYYLGDDISKCKGLDAIIGTDAQVFAKGSDESAGKDGSFWHDLVRCDVCNLTGTVTCANCTAGKVTVACTACEAGKIACEACSGVGTDCETCAATGKVDCQTCSGTGSVTADCEVCGGDAIADCTSCQVNRLAWSFKEGVLTIGGANVMPDFEVDEAPWLKYTNVKEIVFSSNITTIGQNAFAGMKGVEKITFHEKLYNIPRNAFEGSDYWNNEANWVSGALMAGAHLLAFDPSKIDTAVTPIPTVPQATKVIIAEAFKGCEGITELVLPAYFDSIDATAFDALTGVTTIYYYGQNVNAWNKISEEARADLASAKVLYRLSDAKCTTCSGKGNLPCENCGDVINPDCKGCKGAGVAAPCEQCGETLNAECAGCAGAGVATPCNRCGEIINSECSGCSGAGVTCATCNGTGKRPDAADFWRNVGRTPTSWDKD